MAEVIAIRVGVFFVAFFVLRFGMLSVMPGAKRGHALVLLGVSTLIAFLVGAVVLDDSIADTLLAWLVIYAIISALWFGRWKGQEYDRSRRREAGLPEERYEAGDPRRE